MYLFLDANIVLGYYLPQSLDFAKARERIQTIIDSVRTKQSSHFLYVPNFCIAEIFSNLLDQLLDLTHVQAGRWRRKRPSRR